MELEKNITENIKRLGPACRIYQVMRYKGFPTKAEFAAYVGWNRQHLNTLLSGNRIGLTAFSAIINKFPDISARWLITGEGLMVDLSHHEKAIHDWHTLERFIHIMTPEERRRIDAGLGYDIEDINRWSVLAHDFYVESEKRFCDSEE